MNFMQFQKAKTILEKYWKRFVSFGTGLLVLFGILDYANKWGIFSYLFKFISNIWLKVSPYLNILFLLWLLILTILFIKQTIEKGRKQSMGVDEGTMSKIIKSLEERFKKIIDLELKTRFSQINSELNDMRDKFLEIKRKNLESSIEDASAKEKSAMIFMIELLKMDIKKGWEWRIDKDLEVIRDHLKKYKISIGNSTALIKQLDLLGKEYEKIEKEIKELMVTA